MKEWLKETRAASVGTLGLVLICCGIYPVAVWGVSAGLFPRQASGSLIRDKQGRAVGSRWIGQGFSGPRYFHSRPSAAGNGYDATSSGGSNLGPTSQKLRDQMRERVTAYREENKIPSEEPIPADAATASASGLDPHISPKNAQLQARRVAESRGLELGRVRELIDRHTEAPDLGFLGEARVHVLELNLDLDRLVR